MARSFDAQPAPAQAMTQQWRCSSERHRREQGGAVAAGSQLVAPAAWGCQHGRALAAREQSAIYSRSQALRVVRVLMFLTAQPGACTDNAADSAPRMWLSSRRCCSAAYAGHNLGRALQRTHPCRT